ncbi:unnamed protein product [Ciceribacter selenitireducens ATCC BAA-1503]|uniref:Uncharacterized protein n=1 Tax=Ciceribacter selenitireducens ATCC BAA-1503 TaxID=1336235 RepID=A0A376AI01_9HYPH|nr:unnamed protein product [Ciceribacter selenitireducens ATCC BAA-1503]
MDHAASLLQIFGKEPPLSATPTSPPQGGRRSAAVVSSVLGTPQLPASGSRAVCRGLSPLWGRWPAGQRG